MSNARSGGSGPGPCDGNSPQLAPETNGRVRHTLKRGSPPLSPIRRRPELGTGKPTLPGKAGSGQTVRELRRVGPSRVLRPTSRVEEGSLTINLIKNPNTRQNSNAGWNPDRNPDASSNPNQNPDAISNPNRNPNAGWKIRIAGNPNAAGNTNIRRNPNARGNRNLGRNPNLLVAEQVSAKETAEVERHIGNWRGRSYVRERRL